MSDPPIRPDPKAIPAEIDRWNWGAFLLNWIWGIGNNTYIALLALIPGVSFIMLFVLGAKGSAWAWRNGRWDSVEHFKRVQRKWAIWGAVLWIGMLVLVGGAMGGGGGAVEDGVGFPVTVFGSISSTRVPSGS